MKPIFLGGIAWLAAYYVIIPWIWTGCEVIWATVGGVHFSAHFIVATIAGFVVGWWLG